MDSSHMHPADADRMDHGEHTTESGMDHGGMMMHMMQMTFYAGTDNPSLAFPTVQHEDFASLEVATLQLLYSGIKKLSLLDTCTRPMSTEWTMVNTRRNPEWTTAG
ncbi:unnamed protein product [Cyprideis torosa]|uniref:Uncharacterized protein n=1 Tax=Cyprideis torosa TaxID=163714 RepID=A0A7R8W6G1_9CRUS|nr:unnamed protein product [Cyprideis torosa]CAG0885182.1 unnamed protein product [Cyprideis torosa]